MYQALCITAFTSVILITSVMHTAKLCIYTVDTEGKAVAFCGRSRAPLYEAYIHTCLYTYTDGYNWVHMKTHTFLHTYNLLVYLNLRARAYYILMLTNLTSAQMMPFVYLAFAMRPFTRHIPTYSIPTVYT